MSGSLFAAPETHQKRGIAATTFFSSLAYSAIVFVVQVVAFCLLRTRIRRIYEPRTFMVPKCQRVVAAGEGLFDWIEPVCSWSLDYVREKSGLDAYFFLRYTYVAIYTCGACAALILPIVLPINVTGDDSHRPSNAQGLDRLSWTNVSPAHSMRFTSQWALAILLVVFLCCIFHYELSVYVHVRHETLQAESHWSKPSASTILVKALPKTCDTETKVRDMFANFPGGIDRVWIHRDYSNLVKLLRARDALVSKLEAAVTQSIRHMVLHNSNASARREAKQQTTITSLMDELNDYNDEIDVIQNKPDILKPSNCCFIRFKSQLAAHLACQANVFGTPRVMGATLCEVDPRGIIWNNMGKPQWVDLVKSMVVSVVTIAMIIGWSLPVAIAAMVAQLDNLVQLFPFMEWVFKVPSKIRFIVSGVLPALVLNVLMSLVPAVFRLLTRYKHATHMHADLAFQKYFFAFLFIQVFLVVTVTSSMADVVVMALESPTQVPSMIAADLPKASNFFFGIVMIEGFTLSGNNLIQLDKLLPWLWDCWQKATSTPRACFNRATDFSSWDWGSVYPKFTNLLAITIVYAVISPLVLVFALVAFCLFYVTFKYRVIFCNSTKYESNGLHYPVAIFQLFAGVYCMEICMIGLLAMARDNEDRAICYPHALIMSVVLLITAIYHHYLRVEFAPLTEYIPAAIATRTATPIPIHPIRPEHQKQHNDLFDELEMNFNELTHEQQQYMISQAYTHPAMKAKTPCLWIPKDPLGIAQEEIKRIRNQYPSVKVSCADCEMDNHGHVSFTKAPPDYDPSTRMEL